MKTSKLTREALRLIEAMEPHAQAVWVRSAYLSLRRPARRSFQRKKLLTNEQRRSYRNWQRQWKLTRAA
jgi:hypothetical protein